MYGGASSKLNHDWSNTSATRCAKQKMHMIHNNNHSFFLICANPKTVKNLSTCIASCLYLYQMLSQ